MALRAIAGGVLAALLWATNLAAAPLSTQAVVGDLTFFRDVWAPKDLSFSPPARARLKGFIDDQIAHARPMEPADLALIFAEAQAFSGNNHTTGDMLQLEGLFHTLPISFWEFRDGPVVTRAHPQFRRLLGARIVRIGGVGYDEAKARVAKYIAGTRERHRFLTPFMLTRLEALQAVGLATDGAATFEFVSSTGETITERLGAAPSPDPAAVSPTWRASMVPGKGPDPWPHVLDALPKLPLSVQAPDEMIATRLDDGRVLYIRSNSLSPYEGEMTVQLKAYVIMDTIARSGRVPSDIIVDLRYNGGGNFLNITNFAVELTGVLPPSGRVYVITGRSTNSAAIAFAALLKADAKGRATIVGEEVSDNLSFWSEGNTITAPASKLQLHYTDGHHDWGKGCTDLARCYWPVVFHGAAVGTLKPDIPVDLSFADYAAGKDPALEAALADIARRH